MNELGPLPPQVALAWGAAFGLEPSPREAYRLAVEAVEDAAVPLMGFNASEKPTLGHVIRKLNGTTFDAAAWTLPFQREDEHYSNGKTVVAMLKTLWAGQADRHGGDHEHATKVTISQGPQNQPCLSLCRWSTGSHPDRSKSELNSDAYEAVPLPRFSRGPIACSRLWHKLDQCLVDDGFSPCVGQVFVVMAAMIDKRDDYANFLRSRCPLECATGVIGDDLLVCLWRMHICGMRGSDQATELKKAPASSATCSGHSHKTG